MRMQGYAPPRFAVPRFRTLLIRGVGAAIAALFCGGIIYAPFWSDQPTIVQGVVFMSVFDAFFLLLLTPLLSKSWRPALLFGLRPERPLLRRYTFLVFPLVVVSISSTFLLYLPLSYIAPSFVAWKLLDQPQLISGASVTANLLCFFHVVVFTPVFEEFIFRGLLLTRWSLKWNLRTGIFLSSALFAVGHTDILGHFFFAYVMCVLYIRTKSLFVPIAIHAVNNGIAWALEGVGMLVTDSEATATLADFQSYWWFGLLMFVIVVPWVLRFIKTNMPAASWRVPYLALQETDQETEVPAEKYLAHAA